jgi:hypothetical protein
MIVQVLEVAVSSARPIRILKDRTAMMDPLTFITPE